MSVSPATVRQSESKKFRSDINGLRAIAVAAVVLFHFEIAGFSGGFVGVDVFFVISGYLMTKIIFDRIDRGTFSILGFFYDRARRIVPALIVLCAVLLGVAWFVLIPNDLLVLGKHSASAVMFLSNLVFWKESGYFDLASREKWLLHTWSLSVEFQFYLVYPILAVLLARFTPRKIAVAILGLIGVASFGLSIYQTAVAPTAAFFLLPARAWELLAGAMVYFLPLRASASSRRLIELAGLCLILAAIFVFGPEAPWPGWRAIVPVAGAAFVILADQPGSVWAANPVTTWLGKSSYSIYLWHWPVVVGLNYWLVSPELIWILVGVGASLALGSLSYLFVEIPSQRWLARDDNASTFRRYGMLASFLAVLIVVAGAGAAVWIKRGVPSRFSPLVAIADAAARDFNTQDTRCFVRAGQPAPPCIIGGDGKTGVVEMIGDSHASSTVTALAAAVPKELQGGVRYEAYASCPTLLHGVSPNPENLCFAFNRKFLDPVVNGPASEIPIVVINNWRSYAEAASLSFATDDGSLTPFSFVGYRGDLQTTLCQMARKRPTYVVLPLPDYPVRIAQTLARSLTRDPKAPDITMPIGEYRQRQGEMAEVLKETAKCGVHLLDPAPFLCPDGKCMGSLNGHPLYFDNHHLNEYGNKFLTPMFAEIFASSASKAGAAPLQNVDSNVPDPSKKM
ncbi:Peptidoglycan/LPS O-acetylase OafA/YrhL, contains acyltransferase and SGNH-hydrolase domains [Kaistia soli DSM 19436]|uniref:Peptidoglycan/LPS O-acetylase OafA/YrhL, contains acyltransferase and SGNH-hydrolase domains n=1 Tax=Kaistia soli DSM 19436 TaxID=1122133 RepID=A0A1M5NGG6_9HYPH|nr:acyltransferase family protein [Kaistia soli]SHG88063.1 Peptidoglycan/LPS O-acetylase OafA/YrhL, contains acyltransferase and SGNH-hydrolase domains [Kaistia soli DSM 19436]